MKTYNKTIYCTLCKNKYAISEMISVYCSEGGAKRAQCVLPNTILFFLDHVLKKRYNPSWQRHLQVRGGNREKEMKKQNHKNLADSAMVFSVSFHFFAKVLKCNYLRLYSIKIAKYGMVYHFIVLLPLYLVQDLRGRLSKVFANKR